MRPTKLQARAFFAFPMADVSSNADYRDNRSFALDVLKEIETAAVFKDVYCAARELDSTARFSASADALLTDYRALLRADVFLMLYPRAALSSVLIEAGIAIALKKEICIVCRSIDDLPFLLRATGKHHAELPSIQIVEWLEAAPDPSLVANKLLDYCSRKLNISRRR